MVQRYGDYLNIISSRVRIRYSSRPRNQAAKQSDPSGKLVEYRVFVGDHPHPDLWPIYPIRGAVHRGQSDAGQHHTAADSNGIRACHLDLGNQQHQNGRTIGPGDPASRDREPARSRFQDILRPVVSHFLFSFLPFRLVRIIDPDATPARPASGRQNSRYVCS